MILITVVNGCVVVDKASITLYNNALGAYNNTGKQLLLTVEEYSPKTTEQQEKLYKALILKGCEATGYKYEDFENELIQNFAPFKYITSILGDKVKIRKSFIEMTNKEFNLFLEQSLEFCSDFFGFKF